jgi:hypothetical protein
MPGVRKPDPVAEKIVLATDTSSVLPIQVAYGYFVPTA